MHRPVPRVGLATAMIDGRALDARLSAFFGPFSESACATFTAAGFVERRLVPEDLEGHAELVRRYDVEVRAVAPKLTGRVTNERKTLTSEIHRPHEAASASSGRTAGWPTGQALGAGPT